MKAYEHRYGEGLKICMGSPWLCLINQNAILHPWLNMAE